jgi:hypothetical protein
LASAVLRLDGHRNVLAAQDATLDVRGSLWSVYGLFGLVILVVTTAWIANVALRLRRGTLPPNRWQRATRFLVPGVGMGLVFVFTLSALRIVAPTAMLWLPVVIGAAAVMFAFGYLTPEPARDHVDDGESDNFVPAHALLPGDGW